MNVKMTRKWSIKLPFLKNHATSPILQKVSFSSPFSQTIFEHFFSNSASRTCHTHRQQHQSYPMSKASQRVRRPTSKAAQVISSTTATSDNEAEGKQVPKARRIHWNPGRTERLLDWLEENPEERQKLFSDSSKDAKDEGRRKHVAKSTKSEYHKMIALAVFSVDCDASVRNDCVSNPLAYTKSVDNYLSRYVPHIFISSLTLILSPLSVVCVKNTARSTKNSVRLVPVYDMKIWRWEVLYKTWLVSMHNSCLTAANLISIQNNLSKTFRTGSACMASGARYQTSIHIQHLLSPDRTLPLKPWHLFKTEERLAITTTTTTFTMMTTIMHPPASRTTLT
jgi:hypothetical protein